jgi:trk system potassium uptake protein TrkH
MAGGSRGTELSYAVRPSVVLTYFGQLCFVFGVVTVVPVVAALLVGDLHFALRCGAVMAVFLAGGALLARLRPGIALQRNEALVIVGLIFLAAPLAMVYPMKIPALSLTDTIFESISAITTTGLTTLASLHDKPRIFLFLRAWMQWIGGLGFVVLTLVLVIQPGLAARHLAGRSTGEEDLVGNTRTYARLVLIVYAILTGVALLVLLAAGVGPFDALTHTMAAVSTGGFSTRASSIAGLGGWGVQALVMLACVGGAMPLSMYYRAARRDWREVTGDLQLRGVLLLGLLFAVMMTVLLRWLDGMGWREALRHGPLLAFSAQTTAGFSTTDVARLDFGAKLVLIASMFVGGAIGSTAGGIKVLRFLVLESVLATTLRRTTLPPHAVLEPRLRGRRIESREIEEALGVVSLFTGAIALSWLAFLVCGHRPLDALLDVVSACGTVGLSAGVTGAGLETPLKVVLCIDMLMGRLEMFTFLVLLYPGTWLGKRSGAV